MAYDIIRQSYHNTDHTILGMIRQMVSICRYPPVQASLAHARSESKTWIPYVLRPTRVWHPHRGQDWHRLRGLIAALGRCRRSRTLRRLVVDRRWQCGAFRRLHSCCIAFTAAAAAAAIGGWVAGASEEVRGVPQRRSHALSDRPTVCLPRAAGLPARAPRALS